MRKRKSPIALVTVLVVMASVAFGMQYVQSKGASPADQPPTPQVEDAKQVGDARPAESSSSVAAGVRGALNSSSATPAEATPVGRPGGRPGAPSSPLILKPAAATAKPEKPKPNTSSTSAQWYNDESSFGAQKD